MTYFKDDFIARTSPKAASHAFNTEHREVFLSCAEVNRSAAMSSDDETDYTESDNVDYFTDMQLSLTEDSCDDAIEHYHTDPLEVLMFLEDQIDDLY